MQRISKFHLPKPVNLLLSALIVFSAGCSFEKKNWYNRQMQNLTAHYNVLFNANELLRLKQESYAAAFVDNYNEVLSVYPDTTAKSATLDKDLDAALTKANNIINLKEQSHYQGDAYLVLGRANYLGGNYFNAEEYFTYVTRSFPQRLDLVQQALAWKTRALIYLNQLPEAKLAADSGLSTILPKKRPPADIYAAKLQYDIYAHDYADAVEMGKLAVQYCRDKPQRLRWTFILAQVQEMNGNHADAFKNYTQIAKSNASFEMAFNASLNRIRIADNQNGVKESKSERLLGLLKDPNNKEFKDQIYYQVAEIYRANKDIPNAIKYYKLSVRSSVKNQSQKGLSYLRLAQINFSIKADYITSKKYYDSTLMTLPANYPGYQNLQKIGTNLKLLADRLQVIALEDTLQSLAKMDEKTRSKVIDKMVSDHTLQQQQAANSAAANLPYNSSAGGSQLSSGGTGGKSSFYFYNSAAVGQGVSDFKRTWGNRKLEDNWRRSSRASSDITNNQATSIKAVDPDAPPGPPVSGKADATAGGYRQELIKGMPLTSDQLAQSNQRIYNAYVDVGNFYRDIIDDKTDAITTYELILRRFPNDPNKPAIYYNLYRLYSDIDPKKSEDYKNRILKEYPETAFAKVILDPDYAKKLDDKDAAFTNAYNQIFDLYANKQYKDVITAVPELLKKYPDNKLSAQLYYLKTIAEGHDETAAPFRDSLMMVSKKFPDDKLIAPLVTQHLAFMDANQADMQARKVVLADDDPKEVPFTLTNEYKKQTEYRKRGIKPFFAQVPQQRIPDKKPPVVAPVKKPDSVKVAQVVVPPPIKKQDTAKVVQTVVKPPVTKTDTVKVVANKPVIKTDTAKIAANKPAIKTDTTKALAVVNKPVPKVDTAKTLAAVPKPDTAKIQTVISPPVVQKDTTGSLFATQPTIQPPVVSNQPAVNAGDVGSSIFARGDSSNFYFVVNVASGTTNVASSRFGIGQFNRVNYTGKGIKHQLKSVGDDNQLIFVGRFYSVDEVKKYARQIIPFMPEIMKIPKDKYSFFIITQENLDKLADKKTLDSYTEYYQKNY